MKHVISARDIEDLIAKGGDASAIPSDAILTPSARDLLRDKLRNRSAAPVAAAPAASTAQAPAKQYNSKSPKAELEAYFSSPYMHDLKLQICDLGRRLWAREYVDGNGGNISIRVGEDIVLCTPTMVSKGFMKPEDMCLVDMEGNQLLGIKKRTSEALMHLQMMKRQPMAKSVVHCHPPYATAFAVAEILPPTCMIPEYEVFCSVAIAPYRTPGTPEMGKLVAEGTITEAKAEAMAREVGEKATAVTWYTFLGTVISMLAAAIGGYVGSGPSVRIFGAVRPVTATRVA